MDLSRQMKQRTNTVFLILCLTVCIQIIAVLPGSFLTGIATLTKTELSDYYVAFLLPQFLYPVLVLCLIFTVFSLSRIRPAEVVTLHRPSASEFLPWLGVFLAVSTVMNRVVDLFVRLFASFGITIPDTFSGTEPSNAVQAVLYFVVLAVLPPIEEEILCRATVAGLLKPFHPRAAVILSAFAFGMMHATLQQIPFAFVLGIILALCYLKTGNLLCPILLHFANNAWACALTLLSVFSGDSAAELANLVCEAVFLLGGIVGFFVLLKRRGFSLKDQLGLLSTKEAWSSALRSPALWIFTTLFLVLTVFTQISLS